MALSDLDELARPLPNRFKLKPGIDVGYQGKHHVIIAQIDVHLFLVENQETQERYQAEVTKLTYWVDPGVARRKVPDLATISEQKIAIGLKRQEKIEGLLRLQYRTRQDVQYVADELQLSVPSLYRLMKQYQNEGSWTCLVPHIERSKPRRKRLDPAVEGIVQTVISELYLTRNQVPLSDVVKEARIRCQRAGLRPPAPNSVRDRAKARDARDVMAARKGAKAAKARFDPVYGAHDPARWPLQRVQIDHTVADVFVVDDEVRQSVARPILTIVFDEFSRCVLGFHLSLRAPSTLSVALALTQAILPKDDYLRQLQLDLPWPMFGLMEQLFTDNAAEFDSRGLIVGCRQYVIHHEFRPLGEPHFGGRIERYIGTMMGKIRLMPGATMNSVAERGKGYDPEEHAAYTLKEAEKRIAMQILGEYHHTEHSELGVTPLKAYRFGILGDDCTPGRGQPDVVTDPQRLLLDFLPLERRSVQDYGIQIERTRYHAPILRALLRNGKPHHLYVVRYDPRDMRQVYLYTEEDGEYHLIPREKSHLPPVALWEVKAAIQRLKSAGQDLQDENAVYRTILNMRQMDQDAIKKSKRARRNVEQRRHDAEVQNAPPLLTARAPAAAQVSASTAPIVDDAAPGGGEDEPRRKVRPIADVESW